MDKKIWLKLQDKHLSEIRRLSGKLCEIADAGKRGKSASPKAVEDGLLNISMQVLAGLNLLQSQ